MPKPLEPEERSRGQLDRQLAQLDILNNKADPETGQLSESHAREVAALLNAIKRSEEYLYTEAELFEVIEQIRAERLKHSQQAGIGPYGWNEECVAQKHHPQPMHTTEEPHIPPDFEVDVYAGT